MEPKLIILSEMYGRIEERKETMPLFNRHYNYLRDMRLDILYQKADRVLEQIIRENNG